MHRNDAFQAWHVTHPTLPNGEGFRRMTSRDLGVPRHNRALSGVATDTCWEGEVGPRKSLLSVGYRFEPCAAYQPSRPSLELGLLFVVYCCQLQFRL